MKISFPVLLTIGALAAGSQAALAQNSLPAKQEEKMPGYPNLSFQGIFPNPTKFCELGDGAFPMLSRNEDGQSITFIISKNMDADGNGVQLRGGVSSGGNWTANGSVKMDSNTSIGTTFSSGNLQGVLGLSRTVEHDEKRLIQAGAEYDFQANEAKVAAEARFRMGPATDLSFSGNLRFDGKSFGNGASIGIAPGGKARLWAGFGGKSWKDITISAQIPLKKQGLLPEIGVNLGKGKKPGFWIGITVLLPRSKI